MEDGQEEKMARQCWIDLCWQRMSAVMCIVWWVFNRCGQEKIQEVKEKAKRVVEWAMTLWDLYVHDMQKCVQYTELGYTQSQIN